MARTGRFVIRKVSDGYMFELQASNYSDIAESPVYTTLDSAKRSIRSIMENAHSVPVQDNTVEDQIKYPNPKFEIFRNGGYYFFRFRAGNGRMTISSQVYTTKDGCKNGVVSVQNNVQDSVICIETPDGIVSLEEYAGMDDKTIVDGEDPTILTPEEDESALPEGEMATRPGRFLIYQEDTTFRFELLAANFASIAISPSYSTLDSVKRSIRSIKEYACNVPVQDNTVDPVEKKPNPKFEIFQEGDAYTFRFRAKNGKQTISSQAYASKDGCRNGVDSVQKHVTRAEVYIETEDGPMPIEEYTAIRVAIFNASVFRKAEKPETEETPAEDTPVEQAPVEEIPAEKVPVEETPVAEAPAEEAPAEETTAEEAPAEETPAEEAPAEETPAEEAPAEEAPAEKAPAEETTAEAAPAEEAPAEKAPAEETTAEEAPAEETPAEEAPAEEAPTEEAPAEEAPVEEAPAEEAPAEEAPVEEAPAEEAPVEAPYEEEIAVAEAVPAQEAPVQTSGKAEPTGTAAKKRGFGHFLLRAFFGKK